MGIGDKISGRIKQAAGDLAGNERLRRQGSQEERKGEAKEELVEREIQAERQEARAEGAEADAARQARAVAEREEAKVEQAHTRADAKAAEIDQLDRSTDPGRLEAERSKDELYEEAQALDVPGRSDMNKDELADEVRRRS